MTAICLVGAFIFKISVDTRYKRALTELARGGYTNKKMLAINPASNSNGFEESG